MASIRQRLDGKGRKRYEVQIRRKGYRSITQTFSTKMAAKTWAKDIEEDLRKGRLQDRLEAERHTLSEAIDRYLADHLSDLKPGNSQTYRRQHLAFWRERLGRYSLAQLTPALLSEEIAKLARKRTGSTVNRYRTAISRVLQLATQEWQWLTINPMSRVAAKKENPGRVRFLSDKERRALLDACKASPNSYLYPLVVFAIATGARQGELISLRWDEVDHRQGRATLLDTKNDERRAIHLRGEAHQLLRNMAATRSITPWLFPPRSTKNPRFPRHAWKEAIEASGVDNFRFHDLRHTAASYMAMSGATQSELAEFLGHKDLNLVKRYAHLTEQHAAKTVERMVERFDL